ncbi:MAG: outer membrane protein assembly factor BamA [Nitrospirae bacterium]|nr:outer membrane protein assembly factor BamA [Nitrospirota bacterium]
MRRTRSAHGTARPGWTMAAAIALVLLWTSPARAAQPVAPGVYDGRPIVAVDLVGPKAPTREAFEELTKIRPGKPYSAAALRRTIDLLYRLGEYTDIRVDAEPRDDGVALTISFVAKIRFKAVELRGHHQSTSELRAVAGLHIGDEFSDSAVRDAVDRLRVWYERQGYLVDLTPSIQMEDHGTRARVIIRIDEKDRVRITRIVLSGSPAFSRLRHLVALRMAEGEYFSQDRLDRGLARLVDLYHAGGYRQASIGPPQVALDSRGVSISIPIESGPHYRVVIEGAPSRRWTRTLLDELTLFHERRDDEDFYAEEAERLTRFLVDRGFRHATVRIERRREKSGGTLIRVVVDAGPGMRLTRVTIVGNAKVSARELTPLIRTTPSSWLRTRYAKEDVLESDRDGIVAWYRARGFLSATVTVDVQEDPEHRRAGVTFRIEEGPQTFVGAIRVEGNHAFDTATLLAQFDLPTGSPYVEGRFRAARAALLEFYNEQGYIYSTVEAVPAFSVDRTRVDLEFRIDEGLPVVIGPITLSGNQRTHDNVILRELEVKSGDVYNTRRILDSQRRVARLGFLQEVRLEPVDPERHEPMKTLHLSVKERDAGSVDVGFGYANFEGVRGFGEIAYRNLMGTGRRVGLRVEGSRIERKTVLSYRHPWLFDRPIDGRAALYNEIRDETTRGYQRTTYGASVGVEKKLVLHLLGSLVYDYQLNQFDPAPPLDNDRANIGSLTPSLSWDTRDDLFNPHSGLLSTLAFENAALLFGSQEQFWKVTGGTSWFHALGGSVVAALGARAGTSNRFGETRANRAGTQLLLPATERFYVGGRNTVRGYDEDTLGPIDPATGKPTGGNIMLVTNAEVRVQLPKSLGIVLFWDGGNVWHNQGDIRWTDLKTTTGAGLRYNTPVGPLRLDYGHKLNWQPGEAHGAFHFTLGHAF